MIQAQKSKSAQRIFHWYIIWLLRRHFHAVHFLGESPKLDARWPVLLVPNHNSWWDGFFIYLLNEKILHRPVYLMMLEEQLQRYRFFSRLGAYGIEPKNAKRTLQSLRYTLELLRRPDEKPMVCIFPQGELLPWGKRPLSFKRGIDWIIKNHPGPVNLLLLAMRCEYLAEQRAEVFFKTSENYVTDASQFPGISKLQDHLELLLRELGDQISQGETGEVILAGRYSINTIMDKINLFRRKSSREFLLKG